MNEAGQSEEDTKRQNFIAALEKHGSSPRTWDNIASELKWTKDDVKIYAYSYFKELVDDRNRNIGHNLIENGDISNNSETTTDRRTTWSLQESILLDTLMFKYHDDISKLGSKDESNVVEEASHCLIQQPTTVWQKISSNLPGKNAHEIEDEGIKRLCSSYRNKLEKG